MLYCCCLIPDAELDTRLDVLYTQPMAFSMYNYLLQEAGEARLNVLQEVPLVATWEIFTRPDGLQVNVLRGDE